MATIIPFILKPLAKAVDLDKDFSLLTVGGRLKDLINKAVDEENKARERHSRETEWRYSIKDGKFSRKNDWKAALTELGSKLKDEKHEKVANAYKLQLYVYHGLCYLNDNEAMELTSDFEERYVTLPDIVSKDGKARFLVVKDGKCYESKKPARDYLADIE